MKVLIIEDENPAAKRLSSLLTEIEPTIQINGPIDSVSDAVEHLSCYTDYDVVFMDIQLADGKCFNIFDRIKVSLPLIFTTAYDEYAIKAFELNSVDYLLKPIKKEKLAQALAKLKQLSTLYSKSNDLLQITNLLNAHKPAVYKSRFLVSKGDAFLPIVVSDIAYFYADTKVVFLVLHSGERYMTSHTLDELSTKLDPRLFFRINRQYICAAAAIRKVHNYFNYKLRIELSPAATDDVIVSKGKNNEFKQWMNDEGEN